MVTKRAFDLALALVLLLPVAILSAIICLFLWALQGRPVFFISERIGWQGRPFWLWKFRTMQAAVGDGVATGGDKSARVTTAGGWLRAYRLDELPQLWNVLRGDLSFVGPRPPLRRYVARHADVYADVLAAKPGLTGLATLIYHRAEMQLLRGSASARETDMIYSRRCVPRKAKLDLIYQRHASIAFDLLILGRTIARLGQRSGH
ncbi:MAG: sugar transferase [Pseudomonadota bacterium]